MITLGLFKKNLFLSTGTLTAAPVSFWALPVSHWNKFLKK